MKLTIDDLPVNDPEVFAQCVRDSFEEYLALAARRKGSRRAGAPCGQRARRHRPTRRGLAGRADRF